MSVNQTKEERALAKEFAKAKIKANVIIHSAETGDECYNYDDEIPFLIDLDSKRSIVTIEAGPDTEFSVAPNASYRQAVLAAQENEHTIVGFMMARDGHVRYATKDGGVIMLPPNAEIKEGKPFRSGDPQYQKIPSYWTAGFSLGRTAFNEFKAYVPASTHCFLIGYDEPESKHLFISYLPKVAKDVEDAHRILRPKGISKDAYRIGEFFFDPVSKTKSKELDVAYEKELVSAYGSSHRHDRNYLRQNSDFESENHMAHSVVHERNGKAYTQYVVGYVVDTENRHPPVFFSDWHRVVPNNEIPGVGAWD